MPTADTDTPVRCEECGRPWDEPRERWRSDWVDDTDELHYWCPVCWVLEFDGDFVSARSRRAASDGLVGITPADLAARCNGRVGAVTASELPARHHGRPETVNDW